MDKPEKKPNDPETSAVRSTLMTIATAAAALGATAPMLVAAPSADEVTSTRDQIALLRQAANSSPEGIEHPLLKKAIAQARQDSRMGASESYYSEYGQAFFKLPPPPPSES